MQPVKRDKHERVHQDEYAVVFLLYVDLPLELRDELHVIQPLVSQKLQLRVELLGRGQIVPVLQVHNLVFHIVHQVVHFHEAMLGVVGLGAHGHEQRRHGPSGQKLLGGVRDTFVDGAPERLSLRVEYIRIVNRALPVVDLLEELDEDLLAFHVLVAGPDPYAGDLAGPNHVHIVLVGIVRGGPTEIIYAVIHPLDEGLTELLVLRKGPYPPYDVLDQNAVEPDHLRAAQAFVRQLVQQGMGFTAQGGIPPVEILLIIDALTGVQNGIEIVDDVLFQRFGRLTG